MSVNFHVGQKVVCIDGERRFGYDDDIFPIAGETYTIREIFFSEFHQTIAVRLVEIVNKRRKYKQHPANFEAGFGAFRFRPVVTRPTDFPFSLIS